VILLYHRIATAEVDPFNLCVPPDEFQFQIRYLKDRCRPMPLDAMVMALTAGRIPDRSVVVTFDDAYHDNLTTASPVLVSAEVPATFFATTAHLDEPGEFWWDTLTRVLTEPDLPASLTFEQDPVASWTVTTDDRRSFLQSVHGRMRTLSSDHRDNLLRQLLDQAGPLGSRPHARPLIGSELRQLASRPGHKIGAHTRHHLSLPLQPGPVCLDECRESRRSLERLLQQPVRSLAYPFGDVTAGVTELAAEAGFTVGLTTEPAPVAPAHDVMRLPRLQVPSSREAFTSQLERVLMGEPVSD
jgi:peptidoglycan/xylan/chitin deacetylase (PgdA/CDA1 family)